MLTELGLKGPTAPHLHSTALSRGNRGAIGQGGCGMAAIPSHVQRTGLRPILEASFPQSAFDVGGVEPSRIGITTRGLIGEHAHQA